MAIDGGGGVGIGGGAGEDRSRLSAMPREKLRPPWPLQARPEVAMPRLELVCGEDEGAVEGRGGDGSATRPQRRELAGGEVDGDIAAVVDEGSVQGGGGEHGGEDVHRQRRRRRRPWG